VHPMQAFPLLLSTTGVCRGPTPVSAVGDR
jgi:hypothetical protein